ncbi:MAG: QacE family quaternary ammonium compound efflux transporter [Solirubrobacterales bacterium]|jgi:small multidrug resistance pump|nr:QacE family quaternary ammonium compound efflux transporter [Solirubrobacterales bacterium]
MNAWAALVLAILMEVAATLSLKAAGSGSVPAIAVVVVGYLGSFVLLAVVLRTIEVGTTYAIWAGAGTALIAAIGMVALGEAVTAMRVGSLALIVLGVVGLNLSGAR